MALFVTYLDDSGHYSAPEHPANTRAIVFAGFVAPLEQWTRFDADWRFVLQLPQFGLDYFHMKEIRAGKGEPWSKFKGNLPLQTDLLSRLQRVLKCRITRSFAGCVDIQAWDRMNAEYEMVETYHSPPVLAATLAIHKTLRWKDAKRPDDDLIFVVDQGIAGWGTLDDIVHRDYGFRLMKGTMRDTPGVQAGDLLGWELHRMLTQVIDRKIDYWSQVRGSFLALMDRFGGTHWFVLDEEGMHQSFSRIGYPPHRQP
jgi:hypothetical protein